ncbi:Holin of 3TMs, for gene-transfer release [uncultured Caudovirales phage]|uniref:Holin of 3TMs, for gene-transfer release n=1 Tax=uncultured Caudovirales phage TaxID=2100421 RepID=A0A6J5NDW0_9CAUD|nr:Holin of 3TMs, for gene-transfer release [uncultured Caudovirales phage]
MIPAILTALVPALGTLVDRLIPDRAAAERAKADMEAALVKAANDAALAQVEVNKIEAGHGSVFVAGWRPAIGWVCAAALAWAFIVAPIASWGMAMFGLRETLPAIGTDNLFELVLAMLGLGGLRTFEKLRGVARQ